MQKSEGVSVILMGAEEAAWWMEIAQRVHPGAGRQVELALALLPSGIMRRRRKKRRRTLCSHMATPALLPQVGCSMPSGLSASPTQGKETK